MLVLGLLGAILVGGAAALLKPDTPPAGSPRNLRIQASVDRPIDLEALQRDLLEQLVLDSAVHPDPGKLAAITTFTALFARRPDEFGWILERLQADDVPPLLLVAFSKRLPRGRSRHDRVADQLLGPLLFLPAPTSLAALATLRSRGRVRFATSPACRCGFGIHPVDPRPGDPITAVAFGATPQTGLSWSPQALETGWQLNVRADPEGAPVLAFELSPPGLRLVAHDPPSEEVVVTLETR
jgi:hypothetical protein